MFMGVFRTPGAGGGGGKGIVGEMMGMKGKKRRTDSVKCEKKKHLQPWTGFLSVLFMDLSLFWYLIC